MGKDNPLKIIIAKPCHEDWDAMPVEDKGRFCSNCKKTIYDFSHLSDQDLYTFFKKNGTITCGRFHNSQLNREIIPVKKKYGFSFHIYKIAAMLALLIGKNSGATTKAKTNITSIQPADHKDRLTLLPGKIIISGNVKDEHGHGLSNAEIQFNSTVVAQTDSSGNFSFEINGELKPSLLVISYPGMNSIVRSYHPAMQSTTYNVMLYNAGAVEGHTMGVRSEFSFTTVIDCTDKITSEKEKKAKLAELASIFRSHPEATITMIAFYGKNKTRSKGMAMQRSLLKYFVEMEGIAEERFDLVTIEEAPGNKDKVEISVN